MSACYSLNIFADHIFLIPIIYHLPMAVAVKQCKTAIQFCLCEQESEFSDLPWPPESLDLYQMEQLWYVEEVETVSNVQ